LNAELVQDACANCGEGPLWDARTGELLWVDILPGLLHRLDPRSGEDRVVEVGQPIGAVVPRARGGYALAVRDGFAVTDGESVELVAAVELERPELCLNDGACDSRGRFWAGSYHVDEVEGAGSVYRLDPDGRVTTVLTGVTISNGIGWSPDETVMYYVDTPTMLVEAFDYDAETGSIENRRPLVSLEEGAGYPDGLVVDVEGCVWVALWEGWAVRRYSPEGELLEVVDVPAARVTKPAFGGDDLSDLYITSAAADAADPEQPHAGGVFRARPGVRGLAPNAYAG
jgi:sugar lactone lactonase YvrE